MKILISAVLALFLVGCSGDTKQHSEEAKQEVVAKAEATKEVVAEKVEEAKQEVAAKAEATKEVVAEKVEEVKEVASKQINGAALFQVCAGCHGADASKAALGKSQIIKGWDAKKIADALHGYKAGTYGGAMKSLMVGQVSKLSDGDIKALSEHISKL
jgi:cytochrome c553